MVRIELRPCLLEAGYGSLRSQAGVGDTSARQRSLCPKQWALGHFSQLLQGVGVGGGSCNVLAAQLYLHQDRAEGARPKAIAPGGNKPPAAYGIRHVEVAGNEMDASERLT